MREALSASDYMAATYRIALSETTRAVLGIGRCSDGDRVVNYCSGTGEDNLAIAAAVAPTGVLYAVDIDSAKLVRLVAASKPGGYVDTIHPCQRDAMFAAPTQPHVPTHIMCLFGLDRLPDSRLATSRWAHEASPATKLITADWASATESDRLPIVSAAWSLITSVSMAFPVPMTVPNTRHATAPPPGSPTMATVVIREWSRSSL